MLLILLSAVLSLDPVVSDNDILMTRQGFGECRRDLSVDGNTLTIAGITFPDGIGTHATSMIPISVPSKANVLTGACGIDDEVSGKGSVVFSVMSGSEVLWTSNVMTKGDTPASFSVKVPTGSKKLYLFADEYDTNDFDHADWVNLRWELQDAPRKYQAPRIIRGKDFGLTPNVKTDQGPVLRKMISVARRSPGSTIFLEKGEYHFYLESALNMTFCVSNHDQPTFRPIAVPLVDLVNITLECSDSIFYFHNLLEPLLVMDTYNVHIKNLHIDYWRPYFSEAIVTSTDYFSTVVRINKTLFPYHVKNFAIVFEGEGFTIDGGSYMLFDGKTKHILNGTADVSAISIARENDDGTITLVGNLHHYGVKEGDCIVMRSWSRPHPAVVLYRANITTFQNVQIHNSQGMALIAQRSETIILDHSGINMNSPDRYYSASADATHFSNTRGEIRVENGLFEGMMDDAINIHSTSLKIVKLINESCVSLKFMHSQAVGFEVFLPGERIQFIRANTMELSEIHKVVGVRRLSTTELYVTIEGKIPSEIKKGDSVENADFYPSVVFRNNTIRDNRARGSLFTTPKSVIVENNLFDYTSGSAILLAGDAANWYESGCCRDLIIRKNKFINALTSSYQFTNAIISIFPTIADVASQKAFYHSNVLIEDNYFETFDVPILYAISTENMTFQNNQVIYNNDFPSWNQKPFQFNKGKNITIAGNKVTPEKEWTIDDVKLENTDPSEIHIQ